MPIYAYKCASCGFAKDVLQKISDPPLVVCPACGEATFGKQVTAAGFQLKGSGWYVTDFKGGQKPAGKTEGDPAGAVKAEGKGKSEGGGEAAKTNAASDGKSSDAGSAAAETKTPPAASGGQD